METILFIVLGLLIGFLIGKVVRYFTGGGGGGGGDEFEEEVSDPELLADNIIKHRTAIIDNICNYILSMYPTFKEEDIKIETYQKDVEKILTVIALPGNLVYSFEINFHTNTYELVAQYVDYENNLIQRNKTYRLSQGVLVDFKPIHDFVEKVDNDIYNLAGVTVEEVMSTITTLSETLKQKDLTDDYKKGLLFQSATDLSLLLEKKKFKKDSEFTTAASRVLAYVLTEYGDEFKEFLVGQIDDVPLAATIDEVEEEEQ